MIYNLLKSIKSKYGPNPKYKVRGVKFEGGTELNTLENSQDLALRKFVNGMRQWVESMSSIIVLDSLEISDLMDNYKISKIRYGAPDKRAAYQYERWKDSQLSMEHLPEIRTIMFKVRGQWYLWHKVKGTCSLDILHIRRRYEDMLSKTIECKVKLSINVSSKLLDIIPYIKSDPSYLKIIQDPKLINEMHAALYYCSKNELSKKISELEELVLDG